MSTSSPQTSIDKNRNTAPTAYPHYERDALQIRFPGTVQKQVQSDISGHNFYSPTI